MRDIYVFSGLGVDHRVFKNIEFPEANVTFIKWIPSIRKESIENYAYRLTGQIKSTDPIFIGLSFGGMMAIEVSKHIPASKIILIASAKTSREIPFYYKSLRLFLLHRILPLSLLKRPNIINNWAFGAKTNNDKKLLSEILNDTDIGFLRWAIDKIVFWSNQFIPLNVKHIHGTIDRILPCKYVKADLLIKGGGHFMTVNKSKEISEGIGRFLNSDVKEKGAN